MPLRRPSGRRFYFRPPDSSFSILNVRGWRRAVSRHHRAVWRYRAEAGKRPGRASRVCAVADATFKQASCVVGLGARPLAAPPDWKTAFGGLENLWKPYTSPNHRLAATFPAFPCCEAAFPIRRGKAEGLAQSWDGGRNAVSVRRARTAPNAHRASPGGFPNSAR